MRHVDRVDAVGGKGPHLVHGAIVNAWRPIRQVDRHLLDVGAAEVDLEEIGAAQRLDLDALDIVQVQGVVAGNRAIEQDMSAEAGKKKECLMDVFALEAERVVAGAALDGIAAVTGVPDEDIVAGAHQRRVVAAGAGDRVGGGGAQ